MAREDDRPQRETELVLPPGVFAFVLDSTKGNINTYCGPIKQSLSNTDQLVVYNPANGRFLQAANQAQAIQTNILAPKGYYVILSNPARDGKHPEPGKAEVMPQGLLKIGEIENLPGPQSFPLWPAQTAKVVLGHQLRSNQYLLVRVCDEEAARAHWNQSVIKPAGQPAKLGEETPCADAAKTGGPRAEAEAGGERSVLEIDPGSLSTGQLLIIKGTEVSFYIPPTGIEVLPEAGASSTVEDGEPAAAAATAATAVASTISYVRDAVTLERLEYCLLLAENGEKRYVIGPKVVFPRPTETFVTKEARRKFRAYELTEISGLHIKVIADYSDEDGTPHRAGDELFITGAAQAIYYPRPEHAIVSYGDRETYYAIAIPAGEARYVLDRKSGKIRLVKGPEIYLPNPIHEVIVRRVLSDRECELYYPGNAAALELNRALRPRGGGGIALGDAEEAKGGRGRDARSGATPAAPAPAPVPAARREAVGRAAFGDAVTRTQTFTPPRTITLDTKYEGAVTIDVWSGYAVQVVNRRGERRVMVGPCTVQLEYDESLERLTLSTGTPKSPDRLIDTVFLRVMSNAISDVVVVKTSDLAPVRIHLKYLVRFEGDSSTWFNVSNYVQYMIDHLRSMIGNAARGVGVQDFYSAAAVMLRDLVLGARDADGKRPLKRFAENGLVVYDLELIEIVIEDEAINRLLHESQQETLRNTIELNRQERLLALTRGQEAAKRGVEEERAATQEKIAELRLQSAEAAARHDLAAVQFQTQRDALRVAGELQAQKVIGETFRLRLEDEKMRRAMDDQFAQAALSRRVQELAAEAQNATERLKAVQPALVEALSALSATGALDSMARHLAPLSIVRDQSLSATLEQMFDGTPLSGMLDNLRRLGKGAVGQIGDQTGGQTGGGEK